MPSERLQAGERARGNRPPATTAGHEVGQHVGETDEDDQVAERHDLAGDRERDRVAEERQQRVGVGEFPGPGEHHPIDVGGIDHPGLDEGVGSHRGGAVEGDRHQVGDDADAHDRHADESQVAQREDQRSDQCRERDPTRRGQVEAVDGDPAADGDEERDGRDMHAGEVGEAATSGEADDGADDDGQNQGRERHGGILLVVPADRRLR